MKTNKWVETALCQLDNVGQRLDALGVTDKVNRHNVIAALMAEKRNLDGEIESLRIRLISNKVRVNHLISDVEARINGVVDFATRPARAVIGKVREQLTR